MVISVCVCDGGDSGRGAKACSLQPRKGGQAACGRTRGEKGSPGLLTPKSPTGLSNREPSREPVEIQSSLAIGPVRLVLLVLLSPLGH